MPIPSGDDGLVFSVADFAIYLNNPNLDTTRATMILSMAQALCQTIVDPLPVSDAVKAVVFDVAERAFANPTPTQSSGMGMYTEGVGPFADTNRGSNGGLYLTQANTSVLRQMVGRGGAFTIDTLPVGYTLPAQPWWDAGSGWTQL